MKKIIFIVFYLLVLCSCNPEYIRKSIIIKQIPSNTSILLLRDTIKNEIDDIVVWYDFEIYKTSVLKIEIFSAYAYHGYNRYESGSRLRYLLENNKINLYDDTYKMSALYYKKPRIYRIETWQLIDNNVYIKSKEDRPKPFSYSEQKQFLKPYLDSMNKLHLDTLRIGTIAKVQRTNPKFFDYFIKGDSIFIEFYDRSTKYYIRKWLPIEIK